MVSSLMTTTVFPMANKAQDKAPDEIPADPEDVDLDDDLDGEEADVHPDLESVNDDIVLKTRYRQASKSSLYDNELSLSMNKGKKFRIAKRDSKAAQTVLVRIRNRAKDLYNRGIDTGRDNNGFIVWWVSDGPPKKKAGK